MKNYFLILAAFCIIAFWGCEKDDADLLSADGTEQNDGDGSEDSNENKNQSQSIPHNEIHYTSSNSEIVKPRDSRNEFGDGVSIVSNVYKDGEGIITCDGDITTIGEKAFYDCYRLTSINIPDSVTTIGEWAFYECDLISITIPNSVTTIEDRAFGACVKLTDIIIPDNVTTIGDRAFEDCTRLERVTVGNSVTTIEYRAFAYCRSLTSFYCKAVTPPILGEGIFSVGENGNNALIIYVPEESVATYKTADGWNEYASRIKGYDFGD